MSLYENVKKVCSEKNTSVNALEKKLGFPRGSISKWNENRPSIDKVKAVADEFKKPVDYFLS